MYCSPNKPNFFVGVFSLDDADSDEGVGDGGAGNNFDVGHDPACDLGAGDEIVGNVEQDDVSAVAVEICFVCFGNLLGVNERFVYDFFQFECSELMLVVAQLCQGGGQHMLKGGLDTFHARSRTSRLVKKSHGDFKPSMAWLRDACYIVNLEDIKEARGFDVTCVVVRISDLERL